MKSRKAYCVRLRATPEQAEAISAAALELATTGVLEEHSHEEGSTVCVYFETRHAAQDLARLFPTAVLAVEEIEVGRWLPSTPPPWEPLDIGRRFFLVPPWRSDPTPPGRIRLPMPLGTAYGTGMHAPTQIMLRALEDLVRPGQRILDLGTGSGILALAAAKLGAGAVVACDIDPEAVSAAVVYLSGAASVFHGSVQAVRSTSIDLVAANLDAETNRRLAPEIARVLVPCGFAILGGFTFHQEQDVACAIEATGLRVTGRLQQEEWIALVVQGRT